MTARRLTGAVATVTSVVGVLVALAGVPMLKGAGRGVLVVDTLSAAVLLLAALLVFGRFRRSASLSDVALVWAFFTIAAGDLLAAYVEFPQRMKLVSGVVGSVVLLVAAGAAERTAKSRAVGPLVAVAGTVLAPAVAVVALLVAGDELSTGATRTLILLVTATGFGAGAVAFTLHAERDSDALEQWLGAACVVAAVTWLLFALTERPPDDAMHPADVGRFVFGLMLATGAVLEIRSYWVGVGVLEERRRIARELHDGMAQELSCIVTETHRSRSQPPDAITWYRISRAAERALDESRRAIHALISPIDQPLDEAIIATAEDVAAREGAEIAFDVDEDVQVRPEVREALVRIIREAVGNAARHGQADVITVELKDEHEGGLRLRVSDDGRGFVPSAPVGSGRVGLVSMQERAVAVGGTLAVTSSPGGGTSVEVRVPSRS